MTEETIFQEMLAQFQTETGYEMGTEADLAVRLRAAARQIMSLYYYGDHILDQAFPQTAEGENLDRHGALRGTERLGAREAEGLLRFGIPTALTENLTIPEGTVCVAENLMCFETTEIGTLTAGNTTVDVPAKALTPGSAGNVLAGQITKMQTKPDGVETVTNPDAFSGGREQETDESYRERIMAAYHSLSNGTNVGYYKQLAMSVDGVDIVEVIPRINGIGTVGVLVAAETGTVSASTVTAVSNLMAKRRELGITVTVTTPTTLNVYINAGILPAPGYSLAQAQALVTSAIKKCFQGNTIGKTIYLSAIIGAAMGTGAIDDITLDTPTTDVTATDRQRPVLKSLILGGM